MTSNEDRALLIIAGRGAYPRVLAESARLQGAGPIYAVGFKRETDSGVEKLVDRMAWVHLGQLEALLDSIRQFGVRRAVMAGQIKPTHLFSIRMDGAMLRLLGRLKTRNAETIFGAVGDELRAIGVDLQPASRYMESTMPAAGLLSRRAPTPEEQADIELGLRIAKTTSGLDIGQTVVVKRGTVLAVEAFEGTDAAILRAGDLGGKGAVVVKVAKRGHDMRFDIPVIGEHTFKSLKRAGISCLAVEAGRTILLERDKLCAEADRQDVTFTAVTFPED